MSSAPSSARNASSALKKRYQILHVFEASRSQYFVVCVVSVNFLTIKPIKINCFMAFFFHSAFMYLFTQWAKLHRTAMLYHDKRQALNITSLKNRPFPVAHLRLKMNSSLNKCHGQTQYSCVPIFLPIEA